MPAQQSRLPAATPRLISLNDAAGYAGVTHRTIRRWISDGTLVGYLPRGRTRGIRVDANELEALYRPIPSATV